jgi:hypothetical protein
VGKTLGRRPPHGPISGKITAAHLFDLLAQSVGRTTLVRSPSLMEALARLAKKMLARRELFLANEAVFLRNELARSARETAEELRAQLDAVAEADARLLARAKRAASAETLAKTGPLAPPLAAISAAALRDRIDRLGARAGQAADTAAADDLAERRNEIGAWSDVLASLQREIVDVLNATGKAIGLSPVGPRVRFACEIVPLVCGEMPAHATVFEWFKSRSAKNYMGGTAAALLPKLTL